MDYALITVKFPSLVPVEVTKSQMKRGSYEKRLFASASCFPVFPLCHIDGENFIDGGYYDNLPIASAFRHGAGEVVAIDLNSVPAHPHYAAHPQVKYIRPFEGLGAFLLFDQKPIKRNRVPGYNDTMKAYRRLSGIKYYFETRER